MTRLIKLFFSPHVPRLRNLVEHLSRRLASLEIIVAELHILQIEDLVHAHVELASQQPPEDVVRTLQQLLARHRVVVELGARHERALLDVAQRRVGGNCSRRVSEAHEDATTCERVQRNLPSRSSDSIDDALHALSSRDLLHLRDDVDARVVLVRRSWHLVEHDELVDTRRARDIRLRLAACSNHLVSSNLRHLARPLARSRSGSVDEHPLARLDELRVRAVREVVRRESLHSARHGDGHVEVVRHGKHLGSRHGGVLAVRLEDAAVRDAVANLAELLSLRADCDDGASSLLSPDERELSLVQTAAVVRVNEVDSGVLVFDDDASRRELWRGVVRFDLHDARWSRFADHRRGHGGGNVGERAEEHRRLCCCCCRRNRSSFEAMACESCEHHRDSWYCMEWR
mmetsp:Transcript_961/g.2333  ORF Transcript_961/g.2333 Transcript_961/m.2333 type:complete len:401 (+) Transcript_961:39-1241(+)